jgi:hypothetical protein
MAPSSQELEPPANPARFTAARTSDAVDAAIGEALPAFTPKECANYLKTQAIEPNVIML